jgi:hypothetical protein
MHSPATGDGAGGFAVAKLINNPPMNGRVRLKDVQRAFSIYKDEHSLKTLWHLKNYEESPVKISPGGIR